MTPAEFEVAIDTVWTLVTAALVFWMNAGFGLLEAGLCRKKNATMILSKNFIVFAVSTLAYWAMGFGLMFADGEWVGSAGGFFLIGADNSPATGDAYRGIFSALSWTGILLDAKFFFQLVFCGTAATIVSGAVNERTRYGVFLVFSAILTGVIYPIVGHWIWGRRLPRQGGDDGLRGLVGGAQRRAAGRRSRGILVIGPRIGRYLPDGLGGTGSRSPHGLRVSRRLHPVARVVRLQSRSTMAADPGAISRIALTTCLGGASGPSWRRSTPGCASKPDFSFTVNGALAGLVAITAGCAFVRPGPAAIIGMVGGVLVIEAVLFFSTASRSTTRSAPTSVHLANGIWGTIAVGLFGVKGLSGTRRTTDSSTVALQLSWWRS